MNIEFSKAVNDIIEERERQKNVENYSNSHDDHYKENELVRAASGYIDHVIDRSWIFKSNPDAYRQEAPPPFWPWGDAHWKPKDVRRDLVRAAALLIAEIERLDRKS